MLHTNRRDKRMMIRIITAYSEVEQLAKLPSSATSYIHADCWQQHIGQGPGTDALVITISFVESPPV